MVNVKTVVLQILASTFLAQAISKTRRIGLVEHLAGPANTSSNQPLFIQVPTPALPRVHEDQG